MATYLIDNDQRLETLASSRAHKWLVETWYEYDALKEYRTNHIIPIAVSKLIGEELERLDKVIDTLCKLHEQIR